VQRADELLRTMTIEEKAMQLSSVVPLALLGRDGPMRGRLDALLKNGIGHIAGLGLIGHKSPETIATSVNAIQRYLVTETRLKIPAIFHNEALNGVVAPHFSAFPTPIGLAGHGTQRPCRRWRTCSGARCSRWACCTRWRPSWTSPAMPGGDG
jgi:beta-glucosidase